MREQSNRTRACMSFMTVAALVMIAAIALPATCGAQGDGGRGDRSDRSKRYQIAVFGDMPYFAGLKDSKPVLDAYRRVIADIDRSPLDCIVNIGDITNGPFCGDSTYNARLADFESMAHPFVLVYGDNEWTDCARGGFDPLERLAKLRELFSKGDRTLGRRKLTLERQSASPAYAKYRENVRWRMGDVLLVGLNIPGSNNNWGPDSTSPSAEYRERNGANLAWLRESFALATREGLRGIAIFIQADPGFDRSIIPPQYLRYFTGFDEFLRTLREETVAFGKPVTLVHGDSHYYVIDKPMADSTGRIVANFTRAETFGAVNMHWLRITIDPADPNLFSFTPMLVAGNE